MEDGETSNVVSSYLQSERIQFMNKDGMIYQQLRGMIRCGCTELDFYRKKIKRIQKLLCGHL